MDPVGITAFMCGVDMPMAGKTISDYGEDQKTILEKMTGERV